MNILLVEPPYRTKILPLGLQKMATYFLDRGDNVKYIKGNLLRSGLIKNDFYPDEIYLTTLFTYFADIVITSIKTYQRRFPKADLKVGGILASLMPEYIESNTGVISYFGLWKEVEDCLLNFSLFPATEKMMVFTSRGCIRKCEFCVVPIIEPKFTITNNWQGQIQDAIKNGKKEIQIQDNNFLASPWNHQCEVVLFLEKYGNNIRVDFNQSLDCRLFKEKHAELLSKINTPIIRFAFDGMQEDGYFQNSMSLAKKYNLAKEYRVDVLWNFKEAPEDVWYRIREVLLSGGVVCPMQYRPIYSITKKYIGEKWNELTIKNFKQKLLHWARHGTGSISTGSKDVFDKIGRSADEFVKMINTKQYASYEKRESAERKKKISFNLTRKT